MIRLTFRKSHTDLHLRPNCSRSKKTTPRRTDQPAGGVNFIGVGAWDSRYLFLHSLSYCVMIPVTKITNSPYNDSNNYYNAIFL